MTAPRSLPVGLQKFRVSSPFGVVRTINGRKTPPHNGTDWATSVGVRLEACIAGKVSAVGGSNSHIWGYFVHVKCDCPDAHEEEFHILRDKPTFKVGDRISLGQTIGYTGASGALNGARYSPHHHHSLKRRGVYYDPLTVGWGGTASDSSKPFEEEDDMYTDNDRATMKAVYDWIRGDKPEAGTILDRIKQDTEATAKGMDQLEVPDTRLRLGDLQYRLNLLLARDGNASNVFVGLSDEDVKRISVAAADEEDRRERERLAK